MIPFDSFVKLLNLKEDVVVNNIYIDWSKECISVQILSPRYEVVPLMAQSPSHVWNENSWEEVVNERL